MHLHFEDVIRAVHAAGSTIDDAMVADHAACRPVRVKNPSGDIWAAGGQRIPLKWAQALEQNQQIASCCRHPETHMLSAWYSSDAERAKGIPDIYVFHCPCGKNHRRFCVGGNPKLADGTIDYAALAAAGQEAEQRPFWEAH